MSSSDLSSLSPPPSSSDEEPPSLLSKPLKTLKLSKGKLTAAKVEVVAASSPEASPTREPSPAHEYVLADNPDIPTIVMFRARFSDAFPKNVPNLGPQDLEQGVVESVPNEAVENVLCALLGLVLNRKKYVERGHYGRALEEALQTHRHQWPRSWKGENPLHGNKSFRTMNPTERLNLLRTLVVWSLNSSEVISGILKEAYKQSRHDDDRNQPLSVQSWGLDGRKRRYWLIEGQVDTPFRLYRQVPPRTAKDSEKWWSVAGTIDELNSVAENLRSESSQAARRLADKFVVAVPRLEASEEKRKRKEYRQARKAAFSRPEPGFSLYEGRTRGKRMKYTFSDDESDGFDSNSGRHSTRQSGISTPAELAVPTVTASGRQVRSRFGRSYGDAVTAEEQAHRSKLSLAAELDVDSASETAPRKDGRPRRSGHTGTRNGFDIDREMHDGQDSTPSGEEWDGDDDDFEGKFDENEDESMSEISDESLKNGPSNSLIVTLKYRNSDVLKQPLEKNQQSSQQAGIEPRDVAREIPEDVATLLATPEYAPPTYQPPSKVPSIASLISPSKTNNVQPQFAQESQSSLPLPPRQQPWLPPNDTAAPYLPNEHAHESNSRDCGAEATLANAVHTFALPQRSPQAPSAQASNGWH